MNTFIDQAVLSYYYVIIIILHIIKSINIINSSWMTNGHWPSQSKSGNVKNFKELFVMMIMMKTKMMIDDGADCDDDDSSCTK